MKSNQIEDQYHNLEIVHQLRMIEVELNLGEFKKASYHLTNIGRYKLTHCIQEINYINSFMNKINLVVAFGFFVSKAHLFP